MICLFVLWRIFAVRSDLQPADGRCQKKQQTAATVRCSLLPIGIRVARTRITIRAIDNSVVLST